MLRSEDRMSRREFLRIPRSKSDMILVLDQKKCTGCGLCTIDCPTEALTLSQNAEENTFQIIFRQRICNACGICEKSCPENCLRLADQGLEQKKKEEDAILLFEDKISRCLECGIPLFPQAMVKKIESKIDATGKQAWPFHLCPSCRMKFQFNHSFRVQR
jgi:hydrogenase-4 component H